MNLDAVRAVADAVLYEGYLLYPYRASAQKNRPAGSSACSARPARPSAGWARSPAWRSSAC